MCGDRRSGALGIRRLWHATRYSIDGIAAAWHHEAAFRQEIALAAVLVPVAVGLAAWTALTWTQCALLLAAVLLVLLVELVNSALEAVVDRISDERHALSKRAKDAGSAAVLVSLVICLVVWGLVLADAYGPGTG